MFKGIKYLKSLKYNIFVIKVLFSICDKCGSEDETNFQKKKIN